MRGVPVDSQWASGSPQASQHGTVGFMVHNTPSCRLARLVHGSQLRTTHAPRGAGAGSQPIFRGVGRVPLSPELRGNTGCCGRGVMGGRLGPSTA